MNESNKCYTVRIQHAHSFSSTMINHYSFVSKDDAAAHVFRSIDNKIKSGWQRLINTDKPDLFILQKGEHLVSYFIFAEPLKQGKVDLNAQ